MSPDRIASIDTVNEMLATQPVIGYVCDNNRPGTLAFMTFLELRHFPPGTILNNDYQLAIVGFVGMAWPTVIIPRSKADIAEAILKELGLRRANGIPHCISSVGVEVFPLHGDNLFTVEFAEGHFAYKSISETEIAITKENAAVDAERAKFMASKPWTCERCESKSGPWQQPNLCTRCA